MGLVLMVGKKSKKFPNNKNFCNGGDRIKEIFQK